MTQPVRPRGSPPGAKAFLSGSHWLHGLISGGTALLGGISNVGAGRRLCALHRKISTLGQGLGLEGRRNAVLWLLFHKPRFP